MSLDVVYPTALLLLLAAVPPLMRHGGRIVTYSSLEIFPEDRLSRIFDWALRAAAALAVVAIALGVSGLHRPAYEIERVGRGAQTVLVVDRSLSMDQPFAGQGPVPALSQGRFDSKGKVARALLSDFVARRNEDMFAMVVFSTFPIAVLPLTQKQAIVQATIEAGDIGRGLAETDIGAGLERALAYFEGKTYTGSRIIVLVSDGAGELNLATRLRIAHLMKRHRVSLYWIYIRSAQGPAIFADEAGERMEGNAPERALHQFFSQIEIPYRAYTAENPSALEQAISDVSRLQNLPIRYRDLVPRRNLSPICYAAALGLIVVLLAARLMEAHSWR